MWLAHNEGGEVGVRWESGDIGTDGEVEGWKGFNGQIGKL
jgi:hypothetical protein